MTNPAENLPQRCPKCAGRLIFDRWPGFDARYELSCISCGWVKYPDPLPLKRAVAIDGTRTTRPRRTH